jgi:hypothetical protein
MQPVDWTPKYERTGEALRSLGICYINLDKTCAFAEQEIKDKYEHAWKSPAPPRCQSGETEVYESVPINRIGSYVKPCNQ